MLWRKCCYRSVFKPVSGLLLAVLWLQMIGEFTGPYLPSFLEALKAEAATNFIDPTGNGSVQGSLNGCGAGGNFDCINDGARSPAAPTNTTTDYVQFSRNQSDNYIMGDLSFVSSVQSITVFSYHLDGANNYNLDISLYASNETTQFGTTQVLPTRTGTPGWDSVTFNGLSLTGAQLNDMRIRTTCIRTGGGNSNCRNYSMYAVVNYTETNNATVSAQGTQQDVIKDTNQYVGGSFAITGTSGSSNITSITINETGSIDASANISNVKLFYESDTTAPYTCDDQSYGGGETQYGSTDTDGFSGANGSSVFTGSVGISTTSALCIYTVLDVDSGASAGETIDIQISNPSTDVSGSGSLVVTPASAVAISGQSTISQSEATQTAYHWRNDDGSETAATSATGASQDTPYTDFPKATTKRIRIQVSNEGNSSTPSNQYRLEYASKSGFLQCSDVNTGWTDVGAATDDFDMSNTGNLTDGNNTTDVTLAANGGIANPGGKTFLSTNAAVKDTSSQTAGITLSSTQFVEIEYAIISSASVSDGSTYCFRVTNAGTELPAYNSYPELTIAADVNASAVGTHASTASIPSTDNYQGGYFMLQDTGGGVNTLTSITLTEAGTVDAQNGLENVQIRYDLDTTNPYTCDDQSYSSGDTLFGSATSFDGSSEATFSGSVVFSTTQTVCFYVEYDVTASSSNGNTVEIGIANPSSDIVVTSSTVAPGSLITPSGSTELQKAVIEQADFHWRNNDGNETGATSATGGSENVSFDNIPRTSIYRLRFSIGNTGLATAPEARYQIEWTQKISTCEAAVNWHAFDEAGDEWEMAPTGNLTQGADTIDIDESIGGVGTPAGTFLTDNNGIADDVDITASSTLPADNYLDVEYAVRATASAVQGASYCFRVTDRGTPLDVYTNYAEATIKLGTDFKIQRGIVTATSTQVIIRAGTDYEAPSSASTAFIRVNNTQLTGAGPDTGNSNNNADDVTVYITNPGNIVNDIVFERAPFPGGNTRISWEIVEYTGVAGGENEIIVRDANVVTYVGANSTVSGPTVGTVVDDTAVVPFITSQYNPDAGRNGFNQGLSTSQWNSGTNQVDLTRGAAGSAAVTTYALVEFTGSNWKIQRVENTYSLTASTTEPVSITSVSSPSKAFLHTQKRTGQNNHADFGHEVWLSGIGQVSFKLDGDASTPSDHTSVAYVIENTQNSGQVMDVTRSNGLFTSGGTGPEVNNVPIGKTLDDLSIASIFVNNRSNEGQRSWPEPILGVRLISTTQYELWRSDTTADVQFRTEVVEWPTANAKLQQAHFWLYENGGGLTPTTTWSGLGEDAAMTANDDPMAPGETVRIRMSLAVSAAVQPANLNAFRLAYAKRQSTCSAITTWYPVGDTSSSSPWRGFDNPSVADGTALSGNPPTGGDLLITSATVAGTYEEQNNSVLNPYSAVPGDEIEYDWVVQHNGADDKSSYCFRMENADGTPLNDGYSVNYPVLRTVGYEPLVTNWRWYDDENNVTPSSPLGNENETPSNVAFENALKLRLVLEESSGASGVDNKFVLQYSEYSDFSQDVFTLTSTTSCSGNSLWCYFDGAGTDNALIQSAVISNADSCVAGVGSGCGTHNETTSSTTATYDQVALTSTEFEFTLVHDGARANTVYYFRLYDIVEDIPVEVAPTYSNPSLVTEGAAVSVASAGVASSTTIGDIVTDVDTTPTAISYGSLPFGTSYEAAQQIAIDTNATEGYQVFVSSDQALVNEYGDEIPPVLGTNASPEAWLDACLTSASGCFGYHTTDATLEGMSARFGAHDTYAPLSSTPQEIMYSSIPTSDVENIVYRILVRTDQVAGDYQANITYLIVPVH